MAKISLEIPSDVMESIKLPRGEVIGRLKQELAVKLYEKGVLSFGKARKLAEMTKWDFQQLLGREKIARHYDIEEFEKDIKTLERLS
ncbi:MAG: UPF0175 family protein [Nitrospinae bacterium]|nr:UPF0175 family protein [Nitrospinota bacterium]